jgi:predicted ATPase
MERHEPAVNPWPPGSRAPHNLPAPLTSLVGRQPELDQIAALLARDRLVTLVGAAGIGKTRLGVHSAAAALDDHPDGAWFVDLSLVTQPHLVIHAVASALGVREQAGETLLQTVGTFVAGKALLLVLDNCEHLTHACAALVCRLQRATSDLHVLATSRKSWAWSVKWPGWSHPSLRPRAVPEEVASSDAARLFVARAGEDLEVTGAIAASIARICRRWTASPSPSSWPPAHGELTPQEIETNLEHRFHLLTTDRRMSPSAMAGNVELAAGNPASSLPLFDEALQRCVTGERGGVRSRALVGHRQQPGRSPDGRPRLARGDRV